MSLTAIIYNEITNINAWDSSFLNVILCSGNSLYTCISNSINKTFLLLTVLQTIYTFDQKLKQFLAHQLICKCKSKHKRKNKENFTRVLEPGFNLCIYITILLACQVDIKYPIPYLANPI